MLALIAMAPGQRLSRDKLIAYLWPESDQERGRNLLNVSCYAVRTALGEGALISEVDDLRLATDVVRVDAVAFDGALARADHAQAVALYRGPFLDGFFANDAPELEQWVDRERARLAAGFGRALEALAEEADANRDFSRAVEWWRLRTTQDPLRLPRCDPIHAIAGSKREPRWCGSARCGSSAHASGRHRHIDGS
jgi:DNA-binding SARP family transcriptional activator